MAMGRPTIRDVAEKAGVSTATVSRTFANDGTVTEKTRRRVQAAADALSYRYNRMAVDFRRGTTRTVIALVSEITNPFFAEFFKGIEQEARERGYITLVGDIAGDEEMDGRAGKPGGAENYVDLLSSGRGDGIVLNGLFPEGLADHLDRTVTCNPVPGRKVATVTCDFALGGQMAAEHLIGLGHRRVAQIAGPLDEGAFKSRFSGFNRAFEKAFGKGADAAFSGNLGIPHGLDAADWLHAMTERPTAAFVHNDTTALGLLHGLAQHGISVPGDISVVGYDDLPFAMATSPSLTTVRLPRREWGRAACRHLIDRLEGKSPAAVAPLLPELIVRNSTRAI